MKRRGFNLVELVIGIALILIVSAALFMLLKTPVDLKAYSNREFEIQSDLRFSSETIDKQVKTATAAFLLSKKDKDFKSNWNYIICENEEEYSRVILYYWDTKTKTHLAKSLAEMKLDEVEYSLNFQKSSDGSLLKYYIKADDKERNKDYKIESEVKVLNSINIIDETEMDYSLGTPQKLGNCLAFRSDRPNPDLEDEGYHHVTVSFVLDTSGSMTENLAGTQRNYKPVEQQRINILKKVLKEFFQTISSQDKEGIVDVRVYTFSSHMADNNPKFKYTEDLLDPKTSVTEYDKFFNVKYRGTDFFVGTSTVTGLVDAITVAPGTNVGDGLRYAYHGIKKYEELRRGEPGGANKRIKHYLFVLTDGQPTYYTFTRRPSELNSGEYDPVAFRTGSSGTKYHYVYSPRKVDLAHPWNVNQDISGMVPKPLVEALSKPIHSGKDYSFEYVERLGAFIKSYRTANDVPESIDVTLVGFSAKASDNARCDDIGKAIGCKYEGGHYYKDCASPEALKTVFKAFTESVLASALWYVSGPQ